MGASPGYPIARRATIEAQRSVAGAAAAKPQLLCSDEVWRKGRYRVVRWCANKFFNRRYRVVRWCASFANWLALQTGALRQLPFGQLG